MVGSLGLSSELTSPLRPRQQFKTESSTRLSVRLGRRADSLGDVSWRATNKSPYVS
jgi:hypothetical protein